MKSLRSIKDVSKCTETLPDPPDPTRRYVKSCEEDVCGCILSRRSVKKNSKFTESATGGGSINNYKPLTLLGHLWPAPHARPRSPRSQRRWGQRDGSSAGGPVMENHMDLHHKSGWRLAKPNFFHWGKKGSKHQAWLAFCHWRWGSTEGLSKKSGWVNHQQWQVNHEKWGLSTKDMSWNKQADCSINNVAWTKHLMVVKFNDTFTMF